MRVLNIVAFGLLWPSAVLASVCQPAKLSSSASSSASSSVSSSASVASSAASSSSTASPSSIAVSPSSSSSSASSSASASSSSVSISSSVSSSVSSSASSSVSSPTVLPSSSSASSSTIPSSSSSAIPVCSFNAVSNGDFSTGTLAGWTTVTTSYGALDVDYNSASTYPYYLAFTTSSVGASTGSISQTFSTVVGETYAVSYAFQVAARLGVPSLLCSVNNAYDTTWTVLLTIAIVGRWTPLAEQFLASSSETTLTCKFTSTTSLTAHLAAINVHQACS